MTYTVSGGTLNPTHSLTHLNGNTSIYCHRCQSQKLQGQAHAP